MKMRRNTLWFGLLLCVVAVWCVPQELRAQDFSDHRNDQFATHGTDFWVCFPQQFEVAMGSLNNMLYVIPERDCDVTVENVHTGVRVTQHVVSRSVINRRFDSLNIIHLPYAMVSYVDSLDGRFQTGAYDEDLSRQPGWRPQDAGFHVTSTDTMALYLMHHRWSLGDFCDVVNVLPTEMLRDEYVVQTMPSSLANLSPVDECGSMVDIVATEDSTVVDIIFSDWDWLNRHPGDTFTVTLQKGQLYHIGNGRRSDKYPDIDTFYRTRILTHAFHSVPKILDTFMVDLSGTRITARDGKRIAVFESAKGRYTVNRYNLTQAVPLRFCGKTFIMPNLELSDIEFLRFTALEDSTVVTILNCNNSSDFYRQLTIDAYKTDWFEMDNGDGPFYIYANHPIIAKAYVANVGNHIDAYVPCDTAPANTLVPIEWWHSGPAHYYPCHWTDDGGNRYGYRYYMHIITRNEDVGKFRIDDYRVDTLFQPIPGTVYSRALIGMGSNFASPGPHSIETTEQAFYTAFAQGSAFFNFSHLQRGGKYLYVNDIPADSLNPDSIWCMLDPIHFKGWGERPADSVFWDFGDNIRLAFAFDDSAGRNVTHTYSDTGHFTIRYIIKYRDEATEDDCVGCKSIFTRPSDTLYAHIYIRYHFDTAFSVSLCEGSYTFRDLVMERSGLYQDTSYWTESGCDTLWHIDFVTCPHCSFATDTINPEDLPWSYNGITFNSEALHYPIHLDIGEECDSIIDYYLVVVPGWGEAKPDSVFVLVPNVFTPTQATNNRFKVIGNQYIHQLEVTVFDRQGMRVAHFNGLTEDWDGTYKGELCKSGTYVYYIRYIDIHVNNWQTMHGTVTLIR